MIKIVNKIASKNGPKYLYWPVNCLLFLFLAGKVLNTKRGMKGFNNWLEPRCSN